MKKSKMVILRGRPTSGKSTAYANLQKKNEMKDWLFVDHANLKEKLGRELGKKSLFSVLKTVMPSKKNIIIEEMSEETVRKHIGSYIKKYNYKIVVFQFTVRTETAYKRDVKRAKAKWHPFMGKKKIKEMHDMHDERFDKNAFLIDTNKFSKKKVVDFVLEKLK
jgi:tRNA uridine 5-carbamoylmethylation protein Kti12